MKLLVTLILIGTFLAHTSSKTYFFKIAWAKDEYNFQLQFEWQEGVIIRYQQKEYPITTGRILYNFSLETGKLQLLSVSKDKNNPDVIKLAHNLTAKEFTNFAKKYNTRISERGVAKEQDTSTLSAYNLKGQDLEDYNKIKELIEQKFPGLEITIKKSSWFNWPTITWRHIMGAVGLGAAGYAYYKYYHAR